ncbi:MAG: hypothetical protein AB7E24_16660 [Novosphingobium sp.]
MSTCPAERQDHDTSGIQAIPETDKLRRDVYLSLQICRANSLSLTHLQFALKHGDRKCVLEAVDRLHELDSQMGRLLKTLPVHTAEDPELQVICKQVEQQSMTVAFEKLALVSGVSGPDMVTPPQIGDQTPAAGEAGNELLGQRTGMLSSCYRKHLLLTLALAAFAMTVVAATLAFVR